MCRTDFPRKSTIVADFSGRVSRWETLGMLLMIDSQRVKTLITDENLSLVTNMMESFTYEQLAEDFTRIHGHPSRLRIWRQPKQKRLLVATSAVLGMTYTCSRA